MEFIGGLNDGLYKFIADSLEVKPALVSDPSIAKAWGVFRNIANVFFIIAFLLIVMSQVSSVGISNYGIKRLLPRIIIAAVLVNTSLIICQLLIDISNFMGYGLKALFDAIGSTVTTTSNGVDQNSWQFFVGQLVTGVIATGALLALLLAITVPVLLAAFMALAMIGIILLARQALIVLLVAVAPVAFVLYLLPNTESWYKKWSKLFFSLLMLFPVISVIFGASKLAATILQNTNEPLMRLAAMAAAALPLFIVPSTLKGALSATGALGAKLSGMANSASGKMMAGGKAAMKERYNNSAYARGRAGRKAAKDEWRTRQYAKAVTGDDPSLIGKVRHRMAKGVIPRSFGEGGEFIRNRSEKAAQAKVDSMNAEELKEEQLKIANTTRDLHEEAADKTGFDHTKAATAGYNAKDGSTGYIQNEFHEALKAGDTIKAKAALNALKDSGEGGVEAIQQTLQHHASAGTITADTALEMRKHINANHSDLKGSDARITAWAGSGDVHDLTRTDFSGLDDEQVARQTEAALQDARFTGANGFDQTRRTRIGAQVAAGVIKTKNKKLPYFT